MERRKKNVTSSDDEDSFEIGQYCDESIIEEEFGVYYDSDVGNHRNYKRLERNEELIDPNSKLPNPEGGYDIYQNGKILLRKWLRFRDHKHYWDVVKDLAVQEGFELRKVKHASSRITTICRAKGCKWRIHVSKSPDGRVFVIKTYNPEHNCQCVVKNRTVTVRWIAKKLHRSFARNPEMSVEKMRVELRDHFGVEATTDSYGQLDRKLEGIQVVTMLTHKQT
ncbi:hypothetical protein CsatB_016631 [Cannabis sativa]